MTPADVLDRIAAIKARLDAATSGPWWWCPVGEQRAPAESDEDHEYDAWWLFGPLRRERKNGIPRPQIVLKADNQEWQSNETPRVSDADADFIAHAPDDIAFLLAEVTARRLRAEEQT